MCYDAITIDTNILEAQQFNFDEGILKSLKQFARTKDFDFIISEVVLKEIEQHLLKTTQEVHTNYCKALGNCAFYGLDNSTSKEQIKELKKKDMSPIVQSRIEKFIKTTSLNIIPSSGIDSSTLLNMYFCSTPPFGKTEKKKNEFPDAIALLNILEWANKNNKKILVVSDDNDWKSFCQKHPRLDCEKDLANALDKLNKDSFLNIESNIRSLLDDNNDFAENLKSEIMAVAGNIEATVEADAYLQYEVDSSDVEYNDFEYLYYKDRCVDFNIIEVNDNAVTLSIPIIYNLNINASFDLYIYDSIDKDNVSLGGCNREKEVKFRTNVILDIEYNEENPEESQITGINLENDNVYVYFNDLDLSDENDYYDSHEEYLIEREGK